MRSSSNSLRTVSFNTPGTREITRRLIDEENIEEQPIVQYIMTRYVVHIMIGFVIIGTGITIGLLYLFRDN
jgi:hypothetical protein